MELVFSVCNKNHDKSSLVLVLKAGVVLAVCLLTVLLFDPGIL